MADIKEEEEELETLQQEHWLFTKRDQLNQLVMDMEHWMVQAIY